MPRTILASPQPLSWSLAIRSRRQGISRATTGPGGCWRPVSQRKKARQFADSVPTWCWTTPCERLTAGGRFKPSGFLSPGLIARLEKLIGDEPPARIRPLLARLPAGTRYEHVQLYLKCRGQIVRLRPKPSQPPACASADCRRTHRVCNDHPPQLRRGKPFLDKPDRLAYYLAVPASRLIERVSSSNIV